MACDECARLIKLYREAINASKQAIERYRGAAEEDVALAERTVDHLHRKCVEASDRFLEHARHDHPSRRVIT